MTSSSQHFILWFLHVFVCQGYLYQFKVSVFFTQAPNLTLWVSTGQPLHLICALSDEGSAHGDLFWDDGESIDTFETDQYSYISFSVAQVLYVYSSASLADIYFYLILLLSGFDWDYII